MPTHVAIGFSQASNPQEAALQACVAVKNQLNSTATDLVIIFSCVDCVHPDMLATVHPILHPKRLIGSSTAGIILADGIHNRGVAVLGINSDDINFGTALVSNISGKDLHQSGFELGRKVSADFNSPHRQACLIFADGASQNNSVFVRGAQEVLGFGFPVLGGISSDDFKFKNTSQFYQTQILTKSAVGLLLGGGTSVALGSNHGFKPLGKPRTITSSTGHIIHTIDGKPAVHIYEEFLGSESQQLKTGILSSHAIFYPLGIYLEDQRQYLLKNAVDILSDGSIVCQGEVPPQTEVHLMIGNKDTCIRAAMQAAEQVREGLGGRQAKLLMVIESLARYKLLGRRAFLEVQAIKDILGYTTPLIGMYSFGEIGPFGSLNNIRNTHVQNESILILAWG